MLQGETPSPWRQSVLIEQIKGPAPQQAGLFPQDRQAEPPDPQDLAMTSDWPGLKALVPKGTAVQIVVTNADGTASAPFPYTR